MILVHDFNLLPISSVGIFKSVVICNDAWNGTATVFLSGAKLSDSPVAAVAASDLPPDCVVGGVPV